MAIQSSVTRKFDNNYVQVEITERNTEPVYYKLPEYNADAFQREYKKDTKNCRWINAGLFVAGPVVTILPTYFATLKIGSKSLRMIIGVIAGIIGYSGAMSLSSKIAAKKHNSLLAKYHAELIDYENKNLPIKN